MKQVKQEQIVFFLWNLILFVRAQVGNLAMVKRRKKPMVLGCGVRLLLGKEDNSTISMESFGGGIIHE